MPSVTQSPAFRSSSSGAAVAHEIVTSSARVPNLSSLRSSETQSHAFSTSAMFSAPPNPQPTYTTHRRKQKREELNDFAQFLNVTAINPFATGQIDPSIQQMTRKGKKQWDLKDTPDKELASRRLGEKPQRGSGHARQSGRRGGWAPPMGALEPRRVQEKSAATQEGCTETWA
ncbi:hypothetical protein B0H13DRAFT_1850303 [Mycena leptocephala]|nr:hypothetical protein B0H13DRAFT_1850303 [Mycena leptocephala]